MPKPSVLLLEPDAGQQEALTRVLTSAGYEVYTAARYAAVTQALQATPFAVVILPPSETDLDGETIANALLQLRPQTQVIFTGPPLPYEQLLSYFRAGVADYFARPCDHAEVVARVRANVQRMQLLREELRRWRDRAKNAEGRLTGSEPALTTGPPPMPMRGPDPKQTSQFARLALQTFVDLERTTSDLSRKLMASADPASAARYNRPVVTWYVHSNPSFLKGMTDLAARMQLDVTASLSTGGEVLDRLGSAAPQILMIGDSLPDIPYQFVVETTRGQAPDVNIIVVEGWETGSRVAHLTSGAQPDPISRSLRSVDDLIALVTTARERSREAMFGREIAEDFRRKHADFLRMYQEILTACGERP